MQAMNLFYSITADGHSLLTRIMPLAVETGTISLNSKFCGSRTAEIPDLRSPQGLETCGRQCAWTAAIQCVHADAGTREWFGWMKRYEESGSPTAPPCG